jgi:hypothetical protein
VLLIGSDEDPRGMLARAINKLAKFYKSSEARAQLDTEVIMASLRVLECDVMPHECLIGLTREKHR